MAACYLVTTDAKLPRKVEDAIELLVPQSPRKDITRASLDAHGVIVIASSLDDAVDAVNVIAPEHLELHCADALSLVGKVRNAGAIFVGAWSSACAMRSAATTTGSAVASASTIPWQPATS